MAFDPFTAGFDLAKTVLDKFFPDANEEMRQKFAQAANEIQNEYNLVIGQIETNKIEAASPNLFVSGGRPAAIWVSVFNLFYAGAGISILSWLAVACGLPPLPTVDPTATNAMLVTLLGLGGYRTFEKYKGVASK